MPRALKRSSSSTASAPRSARPATRACTPRPAPTTSSSGASASCCAATPSLPTERVDEVAIAATTQIGDQGLTIGRTAALLAGLPKTVPGYAIDRMCAGAMTAVTTTASSASPSAPTTSPSPAASSTWAATRWARASTPTRGSSPRSSSTPTRSSWARPPRTCTTASRTSPRSAPTPSPSRSQEQARRGVRRRQDPARPGAGRHPQRRAGLGPGHRRRAAAPRHHDGGPRGAEDAVPRRTATSPPATPPASTTAPPRACSPPRTAADELGLPVRMRLVSYAFVGVEPEVMGVGPVPATEKALAQGRPHHRRHRPVRAQRGVRRAGARLPRPLRHRRRRPAGQPVRRRDRDRPPARVAPACG